MNSASATPLYSARDRVLVAATELFATRGFQAVGLRDLASCLGLQAGSLYHHIENKQSLLFELIEGALSDLLRGTTQRMKGTRCTRKRLHLFIQAFVDFNINETYKLTLITHEFSNLEPEHKDQISLLKHQYASVLNAIIADEQSKHETPRIDTWSITNTVIIILFGQAQWYSSEVPGMQLTETLKAIVTGIIAQR